MASSRSVLTRKLASVVVMLIGTLYGRTFAQVNPYSFCKGYCDAECEDKGGCNYYAPLFDGKTGDFTGQCHTVCNQS